LGTTIRRFLGRRKIVSLSELKFQGLQLLAQVPMEGGPSGAGSGVAAHLVAAVVFSFLGIAVLAVCFWLMHRFAPFSIVKEIEEDQNTAVAIVMGSVILGISIIIAAAILG
jgi:putative membrane protein